MPRVPTRCRVTIACALSLAVLFAVPRRAQAGDLSREMVLRSIERGKQFLISQQLPDGSWPSGLGGEYKVGVTSLAVLTLLNTGMSVDDGPVRRGLGFLRSVKEPDPKRTYEIALMIMAMATAKDGRRDLPRIAALTEKLERGQIKRGPSAGMWSYSEDMNFSGDNSNTQFAVLGLRDAALAGVVVDRRVWERVRQHWIDTQTSDGGWGYGRSDRQTPTGSMTVAGIASLAITEMMLVDDSDVGPDGRPDCCRSQRPNQALDRGIRWLERHFAVGHNPRANAWVLYYLYGLERAGRLTGRRFFGQHDWYREGAKFLVERQSQRTGAWRGVGLEQDEIIGTCFALLFLSKGLAPVVVTKLQFSDDDSSAWNLHPHDVRNLTELLCGLPGWPKLMTWQVVSLDQVAEHGGVADLLQSPILYLCSKKAPTFTADEIRLLREYVNFGGFIFAVNGCNSAEFDSAFRQLIQKMYPEGTVALRRLPPHHPIFRAEYLLDPSSIELYGVDFGCRTAIVYSPNDIACLWNKWAAQPLPNRPPQLKSMITRATRIGVNVVAYATGREPPDKLVERELVEQGQTDQQTIRRGLLEIAKLKHSGNWDAAPQALRNLLRALNRAGGLTAVTRHPNLLPSDPAIFNYPLLYMHGQRRFELSEQERARLKQYLLQNGFLFADACCGARPFDEAFRKLMKQLFPNRPLERIPPDHPLFTTAIGYDLSQVRRRTPEAQDPNAPLRPLVHVGPPILEGIEIDGRYAVIYSKYDLSCALQHQASVACAGYLPEDAVKIAVNVVLYALMQEPSLTEADVSGRR